MRRITYAEALNEALHQIMDADERAFLIGQGVISPWYVGSTTTGLLDRFGSKRVIDTPVSENAVTGAAVGAALAGMRPIVEHPRMDFMYLAMDQIANHAANWYFMFGNQKSVPLTIWGIINRGGEQAAQHSQALQAMFTHMPGLKVIMPSTPYDVKGLLYASVLDDNPVLFVDDRFLYKCEGEVPEELYSVPIGKGITREEGSDVTIIATSYFVQESLKATSILKDDGISVELIDPRTIKPLDTEIIFNSVKKTGRAIVVDGGWKTCGFAAEVSALIHENVFEFLKIPVVRITLPDTPAPASSVLENQYYPTCDDIVKAVRNMVQQKQEA